jgi:hypothetical protein
VTVAALAAYVAAAQTPHPVANWALNQIVVYGPGVLLVAVLVVTRRATAAITRRIHRLRPWTIRDLQHYANQPNHPRYSRTPARKETQ